MNIIEVVEEIKKEQGTQSEEILRMSKGMEELTKALQRTIDAIQRLSNRNDQLVNSLQERLETHQVDLTPEELRHIIYEELKHQQEHEIHIFEELKKNAAELNKEFTDAGMVAAQRIRDAGKRDWLDIACNGLIVAFWYVLITAGVMKMVYGIDDIHRDLAYLRDKVDVIQYNQTIPNANFTPWDMNEFHDAWNNQNEYVLEERKYK